MYPLVAKILQQPEIQRTPAAKAALDKEWQKLVDKGCWIEKQVREYDQVADLCFKATRCGAKTLITLYLQS